MAVQHKGRGYKDQRTWRDRMPWKSLAVLAGVMLVITWRVQVDRVSGYVWLGLSQKAVQGRVLDAALDVPGLLIATATSFQRASNGGELSDSARAQAERLAQPAAPSDKAPGK